MQIHHIYNKLLLPFRRKRMELFLRTFNITMETKILDIGGTPYNWQLVNCSAQITLLNIEIPKLLLVELPPNITYIQGDGMNLQFPDNSFDIVFSNSVIEHVSTFENQEKFAAEARRVGKQVWVQTPAYTFFFEPHFLTPFFHFLPPKMRVAMARNFTVWGWLTRPPQEYAANLVKEIRLLTHDEMEGLFPDCSIYKELFIGMTKAFIAIRQYSTFR